MYILYSAMRSFANCNICAVCQQNRCCVLLLGCLAFILRTNTFTITIVITVIKVFQKLLGWNKQSRNTHSVFGLGRSQSQVIALTWDPRCRWRAPPWWCPPPPPCWSHRHCSFWWSTRSKLRFWNNVAPYVNSRTSSHNISDYLKQYLNSTNHFSLSEGALNDEVTKGSSKLLSSVTVWT